MSREEIMHKSFFQVVDSSCHASVEKLLSERTSIAFEGKSDEFADKIDPLIPIEISLVLIRSGGSSFPATLSIVAAPVEGDTGRIKRIMKHLFHVVIIDNTVNQTRLHQLEKDKEELQKKESIKDEFLAVTSHELRTPIQPILGFAVLAKKGLISQETAWDRVLHEARRLQQLTTDILDVSKIDSDSMKYVFKKERINSLLEAIVDATNAIPDQVRVVFDCDESDKELDVEIDRSRITQVIQNILGNATKFTENGLITVRSKTFPEVNKIEISISDTGKGLSEEILARLFEKFATRGHGTVENKKGTGLGLYISQAIIKAHSGSISAFNNNEGGATFLITLPTSVTRESPTSIGSLDE